MLHEIVRMLCAAPAAQFAEYIGLMYTHADSAVTSAVTLKRVHILIIHSNCRILEHKTVRAAAAAEQQSVPSTADQVNTSTRVRATNSAPD